MVVGEIGHRGNNAVRLVEWVRRRELANATVLTRNTGENIASERLSKVTDAIFNHVQVFCFQFQFL